MHGSSIRALALVVVHHIQFVLLTFASGVVLQNVMH